MAVADLLVIVTIGISFLFGAWRGLVKEALSLAFWIAAVVLGILFSSRFAGLFDSLIANAALQRVTAFISIFIVTVFAGALISNLVSKLTSAVGLKAADRALGSLFGIIRGVVIVTLVVMLTEQFELFKPWYNESRTVPYLLVLAEYLQDLFGLVQEQAATVSA